MLDSCPIAAIGRYNYDINHIRKSGKLQAKGIL